MRFFTGDLDLPDRTRATTEALKAFDDDVMFLDDAGQMRLLVAAGVEVHPAFHAAVSKSLSDKPKANKKDTPATEKK